MMLFHSKIEDQLPNTARRMNFSDLIWLEPIARKYGEWEGTLETMDTMTFSVVIPGKAIVYLYMDDHGVGAASMADTEGMKDLIKLWRYVCAKSDETGMGFHVHLYNDEPCWQKNLAEKMGCVAVEKDFYMYHTARKENDVLRQ